MTQATLQIDGLSKSFAGKPVLNSLCLTVKEGELVTLLGSSGSGKTTLLRIIAGLETADSGSISYGGERLGRGTVSYVFQKPVLYPHLTVRENITFATKLKRNRDPFDPAHYQKLLSILALEDFESRKPAELSGGQAQRVGIARALVRRSPIVLFDEPLSSVDEGLSASIRSDIERLHRELGFTGLFITHNQNEALRMGQRVAVLHRGKIAQVDSPQQILLTPVSPAVARLLLPGYNVVTGLSGAKMVNAGISAFGWTLTEEGQEAALPVRVHHADTRVEGNSLRVETLRPVCVFSEDQGLVLEAGTRLQVVLTGRPIPNHTESGSSLHLKPPETGIHFFKEES